jgi:hypothetical protein
VLLSNSGGVWFQQTGEAGTGSKFWQRGSSGGKKK